MRLPCLAAAQRWSLIISPWVLREVRDNLANKPPDATRAWLALRAKAIVEDDELTFDWPLVFDVTKDKPVLCTALACADVLLTLDRRDFQTLLGQNVYGLRIETPDKFLRPEARGGADQFQAVGHAQCAVRHRLQLRKVTGRRPYSKRKRWGFWAPCQNRRTSTQRADSSTR